MYIPSTLGLYNVERVKRVEKKKDDAGVLIYFDSLTAQEVCPSISAYRTSKVAFQKRTPIRIYDYYDLCKYSKDSNEGQLKKLLFLTARQARQFYSPAPATLCDICDLDECDPLQCSRQIVELNRQRQDINDLNAATTIFQWSLEILLPITIAILVLK